MRQSNSQGNGTAGFACKEKKFKNVWQKRERCEENNKEGRGNGKKIKDVVEKDERNRKKKLDGK